MKRCYPQHACARCGRDLSASPTVPTYPFRVADHDGGTLLARQCGCDCGYDPRYRPHTLDCAVQFCFPAERMRCEYASDWCEGDDLGPRRADAGWCPGTSGWCGECPKT